MLMLRFGRSGHILIALVVLAILAVFAVLADTTSSGPRSGDVFSYTSFWNSLSSLVRWRQNMSSEARAQAETIRA